ncbi:hypothetical protein B566_EDAN019431, partial [Ephemera danica]
MGRDNPAPMAITFKTPDDVAGMRVAGRLASEVLDMLTPHVQPGISTEQLDTLCHDHIVNVQQAIPAPLNYAPNGYIPYPKSICTSVNHQVCHGIPNDRPLKDGDIINIDITVIKDGWHGDTSRMFIVGEGSIQARRLCQLTYEAMWKGIQKGRGGDHSLLGAAEARRFCRDHGIGKEDAALIEFLVRHHLTMSQVAQKEDLSDPDVIAQFAQLVWNAWKGKLLEDLYRLGLRALGGARPHLEAEIEARKAEARQLLALHSALPGTEEPLWKTLEVSYFARHDAADIAWHARVLWRHLDTAVPVVQARLSSVGEGLQVLVFSPDRPDLFARICGYFDSAGFSIQDAKIHTTRAGFALDTFQVASTRLEPGDGAGHRDLISLVETPSRSRVSRRVRAFPVTPRVSLAPDERAQRWLLTALDRNGGDDLFQHFGLDGANHVSADIARADGVHRHALGRQFLCQGHGEAVHAGLGGGIVRLPGLALFAVHRRDLDDAAEALFHHARHHLLGDVEHAVEVGVDDRVPVVRRHLQEHAVAGDAGVVHQHVDRAVCGHGLAESIDRALPVAHIAHRG